MGNFGTVRVGRLTLREDSDLSISSGDAGQSVLSIVGQESMPRLTLDEIKRRIDDIVALRDRLVPVVFSQKSELNGYYWVADANGTYDNWFDQSLAIFPWTLVLSRAGYENEIDIESRLSGPITRANNYAATGERWLAPPPAHYAFFAGTVTPATVTRATQDGNITVYRTLPAANNPRYGCPVASYMAGRVRFCDANLLERVGENVNVSPVGWTLSNGLVRVSAPGAATGNLNVEFYNGSAWFNKYWDFQDTGTFADWTALNIIYNQPEQVVIRLTLSTVAGRRTLDLSLRRGALFVECFLQRNDSGPLVAKLHTAQAGTQSSGYIGANVADANGNKYILGSAKTFTADAANGKISLAATLSMDFFLGATLNAPVAGNAYADLYAQYLGVPAESVSGVKR